MSEDRLPSIDKLHASNWTIWKMQLMNFLKARKLWKLCLGTETLSPQATAQQTEDFEVRTACVLSVLSQTVSNEYLHLIAAQSVMTLQQAWDVLIGQFERPSLSNKMSLKSQLFGLRMKPNQSMDDLLRGLSDLVERLAALGAPVDEQDQVVILLCSLPVEFESLTTAYMAKGEVRMGELWEALISQDEMRSPPRDSAGQSALWARERLKKSWPKGCCYKCGSPGHMSWHCRAPRSGSRAEKKSSQEQTNVVDFDDEEDLSGAF